MEKVDDCSSPLDCTARIALRMPVDSRLCDNLSLMRKALNRLSSRESPIDGCSQTFFPREQQQRQQQQLQQQQQQSWLSWFFG